MSESELSAQQELSKDTTKPSFEIVETEVRRRTFGVLSTVSRDHRPHSTGVVYGVSSRKRPFSLYVTTNRDNKKARNITRDPNVSFTIPIPRRFLRFLPPNCVQFQGRAEIVSFEDEDARNGFSRSLVLRKILKLEEEHVGSKAVFIRIRPDSTIHTYGMGSSLVGLLRNIRAQSRVEIPSSRLQNDITDRQ